MKKVMALLVTLVFFLPIIAHAEFQILNSGSEGLSVISIQNRLRDLGYVSYRATGTYGTMTRQGVMSFQANNGLSADGSIGEETYQTLFSLDAVRSPMNPQLTPPNGPSLSGSPQKGEAVSWAEVNVAFPVGAQATITDYNTGKVFTVQRTGGTNHADVEPVSAADTQEFLAAFGGASYEKRSALVKVGDTIYAASLFGWPSGESTIDNGLNGSLCLFFSGSTSDVLNYPDSEHESMIDRAAN